MLHSANLCALVAQRLQSSNDRLYSLSRDVWLPRSHRQHPKEVATYFRNPIAPDR